MAAGPTCGALCSLPGGCAALVLLVLPVATPAGQRCRCHLDQIVGSQVQDFPFPGENRDILAILKMGVKFYSLTLSRQRFQIEKISM